MKKIAVIIDSDEKVRSISKMTLEGAGYTVFSCHNIKEGNQVLNQVQADVLVCNHDQTDGCSIDLVSDLKKNDPLYRHLPVVVTSTAADENKKESAKKAGASAFVVNPLDTSKLLSTINTISA